MNGEEKNESFQKSNLYPELNEKSNVQLKSNEDMFMVIKAADFAARRHRFQMRRDGRTPYINHPVGVAYLLTSVGNITDPATLAAAYLHDTIEDTKTTFEELVEEFGTEIAEIVLECTDNTKLSKQERKNEQVEKASKCSHKVDYQIDNTKAGPPLFSFLRKKISINFGTCEVSLTSSC
uniref:HD domain-containing protein n=1 Tax=Meloidogyne incognita TaxID=6306 RepID=A0A914LXA5_MELIC